MTDSKAERRAGIAARPGLSTLAGDFVASGRSHLADALRVRWPSPKYRRRYAAFARDILGFEPSPQQIEIFEVAESADRVAVSSGHKIGKSAAACVIALCDYCSYDDMRVVLTSTTSKQVDEILWRELSMLVARAGRCIACKAEIARRVEEGEAQGEVEKEIGFPCEHSARIDGDLPQLARTGLKSGFRQIYGFSSKEAEAVAGISGANVRFIADEASGIPEIIFEAIEGNRAGGATLLMFSNPTRNEGYFFDAFHEKRRFWECLQISSEETPNAISGQKLIPGLATREYIDEKRDEWGEDSPLYKIRIRGEFAAHEEGKIFGVDDITRAEERWRERMPSADDRETVEERRARLVGWGRLWIGLDPAGEAGSGDETVFAMRRGATVLELRRFRGLDDDAHLIQLLALISEHRGLAGEGRDAAPPVVVLDAEGSIGSKLAGRLRAYADQNPTAFEIVALKSSGKAQRDAQVYDRVRDELAQNLYLWLRDGGALPEDSKLAKELHALGWRQAMNGRFKIQPKEQLRKELGRSPDRYDAVALACWEPGWTKEGAPAVGDGKRPGAAPERITDRGAALDPYGADAFDPYA